MTDEVDRPRSLQKDNGRHYLSPRHLETLPVLYLR